MHTREHLTYSLGRVQRVLLLDDWKALTPDQHGSLVAFRVRFSKLQEQLGKTMRAVAIKEQQDVDRFGAVLAFMERLRVLDSAEHWTLIRGLRNAFNHDDENDTRCLAEFFDQLAKETPPCCSEYFRQLQERCARAYGL